MLMVSSGNTVGIQTPHCHDCKFKTFESYMVVSFTPHSVYRNVHETCNCLIDPEKQYKTNFTPFQTTNRNALRLTVTQLQFAVSLYILSTFIYKIKL